MTTSTEEAKRWFYVRDGRRQGPVDTRALVDLVLNDEVAEDALVWHSGLAEWQRARDIEEIRRELPPPLPGTPSPDGGAISAAENAEASAEGDADDSGETVGAPGPEGSDNGEKRRRKRKHRHRDAKRRPAWLWPLVLVLVGLMIFLWWLLRRMNEVPPGRIIQTGSLYGDLRPATPPGLPASADSPCRRWPFTAPG